MIEGFSIISYYNKDTDQTIVSFSYPEDTSIDFFELQIWDEIERKWIPYDKLSGIVKKNV
jgi:hypothetical protein